MIATTATVATGASRLGRARPLSGLRHEIDSPLQWLAARWLQDGRRMILRDHEGIAVVDSRTWRTRRILDVGEYMVGGSVGVAPDNRSITYTKTSTEGDIWMMHLD